MRYLWRESISEWDMEHRNGQRVQIVDELPNCDDIRIVEFEDGFQLPVYPAELGE